jgi:hypothetical protein
MAQWWFLTSLFGCELAAFSAALKRKESQGEKATARESKNHKSFRYLYGLIRTGEAFLVDSIPSSMFSLILSLNL